MTDDLIRKWTDLFRVALRKALRADRRILDHDPPSGHLSKLDRQLP